MVGSFFPGDDGFGLRVIVFWREYWGHPFFFFFSLLSESSFYVVRVSFLFVRSIDKILSIAWGAYYHGGIRKTNETLQLSFS